MASYAPGEFAPDLATLSSKFHPSDKSRILGILEEVSKGTLEFVDVEFRFLCRDNTHIWIRSRGKAVAFDRKGKPQRLLGTHSDITDRKPAEEKLGKARNYISNIIDSMPSVLIGVDSQGRVTQWNSEADYDLKKQYDFKTIKIVREYEANLSPVPCQPSKIQQVLLNILTNGAQAMCLESRGDKSPCFTLRLALDSGASIFRIEIKDNGPGMDEKTRRRIFEPFFTTKPAGVGTGLGLSVSYFIITENHGGTMQVVSEPGRGSNFIIGLPIEHPQLNS